MSFEWVRVNMFNIHHTTIYIYIYIYIYISVVAVNGTVKMVLKIIMLYVF